MPKSQHRTRDDRTRDDLPTTADWIAQSGKSPDDIGDGCRNVGETAAEQERAHQEREPE